MLGFYNFLEKFIFLIDFDQKQKCLIASVIAKLQDNSALHFKVGCDPKENDFQNRTWDRLLLRFHMRLSEQRSFYHIPNDVIDYLRLKGF